jgi:hypothetical protein
MRGMRVIPVIITLLAAAPARGQMIHCIDPPAAVPAEAACQITVNPTAPEQRIVLQMRASNGTPMPFKPVNFEATSGLIRIADTTDASGYVEVTWNGSIQQEPVIVTATAIHDGMTTRRQIRLARREPQGRPAFITTVAPRGEHSSHASKYLTDPIEVQIEADATTCLRTFVALEYLTIAKQDAPQPHRPPAVPALWTELDRGRFGCAAKLRWLLSSAVGEQEMRVWIQRDTSFIPPLDSAGVQRYLRPYVIEAVAHPPPAFMVGAALVESDNDSTDLARLVGFDISFPNLADFLKHKGANGAGRFVDHVRLFVGTNFSTSSDHLGQHVYVGVQPAVLLIGPRIADLPVTLSVGGRWGAGEDTWFAAGLINAPQFLSSVAKALGF